MPATEIVASPVITTPLCNRRSARSRRATSSSGATRLTCSDTPLLGRERGEAVRRPGSGELHLVAQRPHPLLLLLHPVEKFGLALTLDEQAGAEDWPLY